MKTNSSAGVWVEVSIKPTELLKSYYCQTYSEHFKKTFKKMVLITLDGQWQSTDKVTHWLDETISIPKEESPVCGQTCGCTSAEECHFQPVALSQLNEILGSHKKFYIDDVRELANLYLNKQITIGKLTERLNVISQPKEISLPLEVVIEGAESWRNEYDNCRAILQEFVELKNIKDAEGKTEDYLHRQPRAWEIARAFLSKYQHF